MVEASLRAHLVTLAKAYAEAKGLELVTVARLSTGDWRFFDRLGAGASFTARKYDNIIAWFVEHWPDHTAWPLGVPGPQGKPKSRRKRDGHGAAA